MKKSSRNGSYGHFILTIFAEIEIFPGVCSMGKKRRHRAYLKIQSRLPKRDHRWILKDIEYPFGYKLEFYTLPDSREMLTNPNSELQKKRNQLGPIANKI